MTLLILSLAVFKDPSIVLPCLQGKVQIPQSCDQGLFSDYPSTPPLLTTHLELDAPATLNASFHFRVLEVCPSLLFLLFVHVLHLTPLPKLGEFFCILEI